MADELATIGAVPLARLLVEGRLSAVEAVDQAIGRIERFDGGFNAVVVRDFERARAEAALADEALSRGDRRPLLGVPLTIKESFDVAGLVTSWGLAAHKQAYAAGDSVVAARLRSAGAVILGKTNVSEGLGSWSSCSNPVFGKTVNPRRLDRSPGGSSGGAAAALAAGYTPLEVGSDLAGSIRVPAHFCGVYGHNSSVGLIPARGHLLNGRIARADMSSPGPMARSARDLDLALAVLAGPDEDAAGYGLALPPCRHGRLRDFRCLILSDHPFVRTAPEVRDAVEGLADRLAAAGATVRRWADAVVPDLDHLTINYLTLLGAALSMGQPADLLRARANRYDEHDRTADATTARAALISHGEWLEANEARAKIRLRWRDLFRDWDAVLCPAISTTAPLLAEAEAATATIDGREVSKGDQVAWCALATGAGLPATVVPAATSPDGLPVGVQIIGPYLEDRTTIGLAALLDRDLGLTSGQQ